PLLVSSSGASARTWISSDRSPTSSVKSTTTIVLIWTVTLRADRRKPESPASTRYSPGGSGSDVYRPSSSVVSDSCRLVSRFVIVTAARGMTPPLVSLTEPLTVPVYDCADTIDGQARRAVQRRVRLRRIAVLRGTFDFRLPTSDLSRSLIGVDDVLHV